ncbi:MAG: ATP-binding cassette domain-containing protein, partial [Limnohabitans sp.]|nr:ATP-binding cassette domain-containing protein [Limnohabitans sp.]
MSDIRLQVQDAACERGAHRLFAPVSFEMLPGQAMHLQGDNGAGKTTLLRSLCG